MSGASDALSLKSSSIGVGNVDVAPVSFRLVTATDAETQEGVLSIAPDTAETSGTRVDVLAEQFKVGDTVHVTPGNVAIGGNVSIVAHDADADVVGTVTAGRGTFGAVSIDGVGDVKQRFDTFMQSSTRLYVSGSRGSDDIDVDGRSWDKPLASIKEACGRAAPGTTIFVESGQYTEDNPIRVPAYVAIVGDNLRRVVVYAQNPRVDMLHVNNSCYVVGLRFLNLQRPAFCAAFPCAVADTTLEDGSLASVELLWAPEEPYDDGAPPEVFVESPDDPVNGTRADIQAVLDPETHRLVDLEIVDPGSGYVTRPHVSIPPPDAVRPFIVTSPYIQNCSSITGPFTKSTGELIPATTPLPYDTSDVDDEGAGGGLRVDGRCCAASSPLRSFVTDSFTQLNAGGPGHMIFGLNSYCQFVSSFTTFCTYGFKAVDGGACNISTSVCDFGLAGLVSKSYWPEPVTTATLAETYRSGIVVRVTEGGSGYADPPTVVFSDGDAEAEAVLVDGKVESVLVIVQGEYETPPTVTFEGEADVDAEAEAVLLGRALIRIEGVSGRKPDIGSVTKYRETWYRVTSAAVVDAETYDVGVFPAFVAGDQGDPVEFVVSSIVATGQHTMEYVGSGCTFNALPQYGGQPDPSYHVVETPPGKVYYGISDELGNQKFGPFFSVAQATGEVSISTDRFNLSGISSLGPFRRLGIAVGVQLREVSLDPSLRSSTGLPDSSTVPTQTAVISYVTNAIEALQQNGVFENVSGNGEGLFGVLAANVVGLEESLAGDISCNSVQANSGVFTETLAANVVGVGDPGNFDDDGRPTVGLSATTDLGLLRYDADEHLFHTAGTQTTWLTADGITTTGDVTGFASDARLKTNVRAIVEGDPLDAVARIRGVRFEWREDTPQPMRGTDVGLLAQEVREVLPEAVTRAPFDIVAPSGERYLTIRETKVIPLLVEAINALRREVDALRRTQDG
jgi:hypothetical protein